MFRDLIFKQHQKADKAKDKSLIKNSKQLKSHQFRTQLFMSFNKLLKALIWQFHL